MLSDTIVAIATSTGNGALGIVRLTGPESWQIAGDILQKPLDSPAFTPNHASFCRLYSSDNSILDHAVITPWKSPASFTGEDMIEFSCHGGQSLLRLILGRCLELGARSANPGEFSQRAFLNGKLSLDKAEAIATLIEAKTGFAAKSAARLLDGELTSSLVRLREKLIELTGLIELSLDFVEEDLEHEIAGVEDSIFVALIDQVNELILQAEKGQYYRKGLNVVIAGAPNVGKSTLLNYFAGYQRAIVSNIPGTTRDYLDVFLDWDGVPVRIVDTAGLRNTEDTIELEGTVRSRKMLEQADCVIWLLSPPDYTEPETNIGALPSLLKVNNKCDLPHNKEYNNILSISSKTGEGVDKLIKNVLKSTIGKHDSESVLLLEQRQLHLLKQCLDHIQQSLEYFTSMAGLELVAAELRLALDRISQITGRTTGDDILNKLFANFCIGK